MTFAFRPGSPVPGVKPDVVAYELARLHASTGRVAPPDLIEAARPADAPLHGYFQWDDTTAAHEFRLIQARRLIRALIEVPDGDGAAPRTVYVHVSREEGYHPIETVVRVADWFDQALTELAVKLKSAQAALDELRAAADARGDPPKRRAALDRAAVHVEAARNELAPEPPP
jgi:hypothetical protein